MNKYDFGRGLVAAHQHQNPGRRRAENQLGEQRGNYHEPNKGEQQGGHVANCHCHTPRNIHLLACIAADNVGGVKHRHPYRDPRCGESIELIKAKARLEGLEHVVQWSSDGLYPIRHALEKLRIEACAAVEKLEKEKA